MIRDRAHSHPIGFEDNEAVFVETSVPVDMIEPLDLSNDDEAERDAALRAIHWLLSVAITGKAIVAKVIALRYLFRLEKRNMDTVAKLYGFAGRAALSKHVTEFSNRFDIPSYRSAEARKQYSRSQFKAWEKRPRKAHTVNGSPLASP